MEGLAPTGVLVVRRSRRAGGAGCPLTEKPSRQETNPSAQNVDRCSRFRIACPPGSRRLWWIGLELGVDERGCETASSSTTTAAFIAPLRSFSAVASTVPANGDVNPYGIALVPSSVGKLKAGQMLVSNFDAKEGAKQSGQGTGATIVQISTAGKVSTFATIDAATLPGPCTGGVGLTTALNVLPGGYVVVGSLPTTNGKSATAQYGCLIVLDGKASLSRRS